MRHGIRLALAILCAFVLACVRVQSGYGIGEADSGTTKTVAVGSELRLVLRADYDWKLESTDTKALALRSALVGSVGGSTVRTWSFDVRSAGSFVLRAVGDPECRQSVPPCTTEALRYEFKIIAQ